VHNVKVSAQAKTCTEDHVMTSYFACRISKLHVKCCCCYCWHNCICFRVQTPRSGTYPKSRWSFWVNTP